MLMLRWEPESFERIVSGATAVRGSLECICCACDVHMPTVLDLSTRDINTIIFKELFRYCANAHPQFAGVYPTLYRFRSKNLDHLD